MLTSAHQNLIASVLTDEVIEEIRTRAPGYDEANTFPHQDLELLRSRGYLAALADEDDGGLGWGFDVVVDAQRRLAQASPATALAVNMHLIWSGVARILSRGGDDSLRFIQQEAAAGETYAFGISEPGNDAVLFDSSTVAEPLAEGGYAFTGTKIFTTLAPVWTRLGIFGKTPDGEQLVFAVLDRDAGGAQADSSSWDMLGMRATQSYTTQLDHAVVPSDRIIRHIATGPNQDPLTFGIFASFLTLVSAVYTGVGERALHLGNASLQRRRSAVDGEPLSNDPVMRYQAGEATLRAITQDAQLTGLSHAIEHGTALGSEWFPRLVANKTAAVRTAKAQVEFAMDVSGGAGFHRRSEITRLYRDVVAGGFHPSNDASAHRTMANFALGPVAE